MEKLFYFIKTFTTRNFLFFTIFIWIVFIYLIFLVSVDFNGHRLLLGLKNWDSGHYLGISQNGYTEKYQYAFFPLYPLLIKIVSYFIGSYLSSALVISLLSTICGLVIFFAILKEEFKNTSKKILLSLLFFPTSFYLLIPYTEGLFFLLTMVFFYFLKRNLFISCIACGLGIVTRVTGFALLAVLIYELVKERSRAKILYITVTLVPFSIYLLYLLLETGSPLSFLEAQTHWQRNLSLPFIGFWNTLIKIFTPSFDKIDLNNIFNLLFAVFGIGIALRGLRFLRLKYSIYSIVSLMLPLLTGNLTSIPRFLVIIFPVFILIGRLKWFYWLLYIICSTLLLIYFSFTFINGKWVS